jgi:hypothetical protein
MSKPWEIKSDIYDRKYCSGCRFHRPLEGGEYKATKSTKRWVCSICCKRMNGSGFTHKNTAQLQEA